MQDRLGRTINVGDLIAYAIRRYSSATLRIGRIVELREDNGHGWAVQTIKIEYTDKEGRYSNRQFAYFHYPDRAVIIERAPP
jgi:hypothetical protein